MKNYSPYNFISAKPLSDVAMKFLPSVIGRRAGINLDLMLEWETIIGTENSQHCKIQKIKWYGGKSPAGGTLLVACDEGYGLFILHDTANIIKKINDFFGYNAIAEIKVVASEPKNVQTNFAKRTKNAKVRLTKLSKTDKNKLNAVLGNFKQGPHKQALEKLGTDIYANHNNKEQKNENK